MYRAVLDTCALVPGLQRDFLLQLAAEAAYAPLWGSGILFELDYVLEGLDAKRGRSDSSAHRERLFSEMRRAFPGAEINAPKAYSYDYGLDDVDDGHVAHAAIIGKADAIVTDDTRAGFKTSSHLADADIEIVSPQEFAANTVAAHPEAGNRAITALSTRSRNPPCTPSEVLNDLRARYNMEDVWQLLSERLPDK